MGTEYKRIKLKVAGLGLCLSVKMLTIADEVFYSLLLILGVGKKHLTIAVSFNKPEQIKEAKERNKCGTQ